MREWLHDTAAQPSIPENDGILEFYVVYWLRACYTCSPLNKRVYPKLKSERWSASITDSFSPYGSRVVAVQATCSFQVEQIIASVQLAYMRPT